MERDSGKKDRFDMDPDTKKARDELTKMIRRLPVFRELLNAGLLASLWIYLLTSEEGRQTLKDSEFKDFLTNVEKRSGTLEDSIIGNPLIHPDKNNEYLVRTVASAGSYISWDFRRQEEFPTKKVQQLNKGRLLAFSLPEILERSSDSYTPTGLLNLLDISDILYLEGATIESLLNYGFIKETTYLQAYNNSNQHKHTEALTLRQIGQEKIFQVTPKGNGLIFLYEESGQKEKNPQPNPVLIPELARI